MGNISMSDFGRMVTSSVSFKMPNERYVFLDSFEAQNLSGKLTIHELKVSNCQAIIEQNLNFYNFLDLFYCSKVYKYVFM